VDFHRLGIVGWQLGAKRNGSYSPAWAGPQAALAVGASFSHHAQGGGIWPDGVGMPDPQPQAPTNQPGT
jgi:hypothetical protein